MTELGECMVENCGRPVVAVVRRCFPPAQTLRLCQTHTDKPLLYTETLDGKLYENRD